MIGDAVIFAARAAARPAAACRQAYGPEACGKPAAGGPPHHGPAAVIRLGLGTLSDKRALIGPVPRTGRALGSALRLSLYRTGIL